MVRNNSVIWMTEKDPERLENNSNSWLAVDLDPIGKSRVVLIHTELEQMIFVAYSTFEKFLNDAIRANLKNESLSCFERLKPLT